MNLLEQLKEYTTGTPRRILISSIVIALLLPLTLWAGSQRWELRKGAEEPTATVYLEPTPLTLGAVGDSGTVEVMLGGVSASAGFQFALSFDNAVIQINDVLVEYPNDLGSIRNEEGVVTFGAYVYCDEGVCPNMLDGSPAVLATLTVSAVGEGTTNLAFDDSYFLYGTETGANNLPVEIGTTLTDGQVLVGASSSNPTPTPTPTPPPAAGSGAARLTFKVKFQGIGQSRLDKTVTLTLKKGASVVRTETVAISSDQNGIYTGRITNLDPDTYDILIKGWAHLQKKFAGIVLSAGENTKDWSGAELLAGDITGDDEVNILDFAALVDNYLEGASAADFNLDGETDLQDFQLMVDNYTEGGDRV